MDPLQEKIVACVTSSFMKKERKQAIISFYEKNGMTKDFFELLSASMIEDAKERGSIFLESVQEWNDLYSATIQDLFEEEEKTDKNLSEELARADMWDADAKLHALKTYSTEQAALTKKYQKKLSVLGAQYNKNVSQKILHYQQT